MPRARPLITLPILLALVLAPAFSARPGQAAQAHGLQRQGNSPGPHQPAQAAWCRGLLGGYLELRDEAMPEVERIERAFRRPGSNLAEDLAVYDRLQEESLRRLAEFDRLIHEMNAIGLQSHGVSARWTAEGRNVWARAEEGGPARLGREWMSWTLPRGCEGIGQSLARWLADHGGADMVSPAAVPEPTFVSAIADIAPSRASSDDCTGLSASACRVLRREQLKAQAGVGP